MKTTAMIAIVWCLAACPKKKDDAAKTEPVGGSAAGSAATGSSAGGSAATGSDGSAAAGTGTGSAGSAAAPASLVSVLPAADVAAVCADSALLLVDNPLDKAGARYCDACGATNPKACSASWPDDIVVPGASAADRNDVMRNTIYAAYGYSFKKDRWKKLFGGKAWYKASDTFKDADLGKVAVDNIAALKGANIGARKGIQLEVARGASGSFDVDGDGKPEAIAVDQAGTKVTVGTITVAAADHVPDGYDTGSPAELEDVAIVDVEGKKPGLQLAVRYGWDEDVESWVVYDLAGGKAAFVGEVSPGDVPGDGTVIATSGNCGVTTTTTFKLGAHGFAVKGHKDTGKHDDAMCAACPYVYLDTARGRRFEGEILRYQGSADAYRADALALVDLPRVDGGVIRVEVREVKPETTYLDAIQLEVDGEILDPIGCDATDPDQACATDRRYAVIERGSSRTYAFAWIGAAPREVTVHATGYYLPLGL